MTINELLALANLTANDEIPVWDAEATGEPTKKITAQQLAASVVALANLVTGVKGGAESSYRTGNVNLTAANIGAVAAYNTSSDNIDDDWGQSIKTFDPVPSGTPPENSANITLLSLGNQYSRRRELAFPYASDSIYYRRKIDNNFSDWRAIIKNGAVPITTGGTGATTAAAALAALSQLRANTAWKTAPNGLSLFFYEGVNNTTTYDLPLNNMIIAVIRWSQNRGIAFGFPWDVYSATKLFYRRIYDAQNADSWHSVSLS